MDIPCRKPHFVVRIVLAVAVVIAFLLTTIFVAVSAGTDPNDWLGKWVAASESERGNFVCTKPPPCGTWKLFEGKCWTSNEDSSWRLQFGDSPHRRLSTPETPSRAQADCQYNPNLLHRHDATANLAEIDNPAQDKYAYDLCTKADTITLSEVKYCFFGLKGWTTPRSDSSNPANWKWAGDSTSTYRNWLSRDQHDEPADGGKTSVSWMTPSLKDEIVSGAFWGLLIIIFYLILVCSCCSSNSLLVWCGVTNKNKCCLVSGASLDGVMCGFLLDAAVGNIRDSNVGGILTNIVLGALFLTGSIMGCLQCGPVGLMEVSARTAPPPVVVGQPVEVDTNK